MAANPHNPKYVASVHMEDTKNILYHVNSIPYPVNSLPSAVGVRREHLQERLFVKQLHKFLPPIISSQCSLAPPLMLLHRLLLHFPHQQS